MAVLFLYYLYSQQGVLQISGKKKQVCEPVQVTFNDYVPHAQWCFWCWAQWNMKEKKKIQLQTHMGRNVPECHNWPRWTLLLGIYIQSMRFPQIPLTRSSGTLQLLCKVFKQQKQHTHPGHANSLFTFQNCIKTELQTIASWSIKCLWILNRVLRNASDEYAKFWLCSLFLL